MKLRALSGSRDLKQFEEILNLSFPVVPQTSFFDDFPVWASNADYCRRLTIEHDGKCVAVGGLLNRKLWIDSKLEPVGIIGAIATRPEYRKQGLAGQIVQALTEESDRAGNTASFLWGSDHAFYEKFGFSTFGKQCRFRASDLQVTPSIAKSQSLIGDELRFGLSESILNLLRSRKSGLKLEMNDSWISAHKNTKWISIDSKTGTLEAYVAVDRGIDLPGIIHDWGGSMAGILKIIDAISVGRPELEVISSPNQLTQWPVSKAHVVVETLALARAKNGLSVSFKDDSVWFWGLDSA